MTGIFKPFIHLIQHSKFSLRWKLLGAFLAANVLLLVGLGIALVALWDNTNTMTRLKTNMERSQNLHEIEANFSQLINSGLDFAWSDNLLRLDQYDLAKTDLNRTLKTFQPRPLEQDGFNKAQKEINIVLNTMDQVIKLDSSGQTQTAVGLWRSSGSKQAATTNQLLRELDQQEFLQIEAEYDDTTNQARFTSLTILIIAIIALLVAGGLALLQTSALTSPILQLRQHLHQLARGDLTNRVQISNRDELGELADTYNLTLSALHELIQQLNLHSEQVSTAVQELDSQARQQVSGTSQQVNAVRQASEALGGLSQTAEEIARQTLDVVEAVNFSLQQAASVSLLAEQMVSSQQVGQGQIQRMGGEIEQLKTQLLAIETRQQKLVEQSGIIQEVLELLDGLARETHLLSLNAAIEAAGSSDFEEEAPAQYSKQLFGADNGTQRATTIRRTIRGQRFAVIAGEVKELADRSLIATRQVRAPLAGIASAVAEINGAIREGLKAVQRVEQEADDCQQILAELTRLSQDSDQAARQIVGYIENTVLLARDIEQATNLQRTASREIFQTMLEIEAATDQTLNSIRQGQIATDQLSHSTQKLESAADQFKLAAA